MECLEWQISKNELNNIKPGMPNEKTYSLAKAKWDFTSKPLDGLGDFESIICKIADIKNDTDFSIKKKAILIFIADNGIVEEKISQSGPEVTRAVAKAMGAQSSCVAKMASAIFADTIPVDVGGKFVEKLPGVLDYKIAHGTKNFAKEYAMSEDECLLAISIGMQMVKNAKQDGYELLGLGEMGIANTTTSSAIAAALLKCDAIKVTGRGAGLDDAGLARKIAVIDAAVEKYDLFNIDAFDILCAVGGFDIAAMVGACIGAAYYQVPIVLDGLISLVAANVANRITPGVANFLIASHCGAEVACQGLLDELNLKAAISANMALGEGTGAVMMMGLLDSAMCVYDTVTTFDVTNIKPYQRYE